ncbi:double-strand break repair protein AddB [Altericroceibacterium endophyticum]|uniref:Double-strand break repair protein AddB n=1 Tax=Altericroceibacterium endophyticum TaxID=1808508 RepID=A0A6I4T3L0_9SPHN|nr:double-strand break repair protein AddB [Altericroceibacterium endophyticum]
MADAHHPDVYSIAAHRGFADALVAGIASRYAADDVGLARLTLLLPSARAIRSLREAFIRHAGEQASDPAQAALLMPRMVAIGDLDLDEALGPLFDTLDAGESLPPAADPTHRWLRLAELIRLEMGDLAPRGAGLFRLALEFAATMDRLLVENIAPENLLSDNVIELLGELSVHWQDNLRLFARVQARWQAELNARGEVDRATRRNGLFDYVAREWTDHPPVVPIIAAGVTSAAPALARLLKTIAQLPEGAVVLPDLDLSLDDDVWNELGRAGAAPEPGDPVFGSDDAWTHPQYHLKLLLNRMGIARDEVRAWHRAGMAKGPPERSHAISNLFLPPKASRRWVELPPEKRRLAGVRLMESAHPEEEAQAVALLMRQALEVPEKRVALVTPDRPLARRVVAHLRRWNIEADDSAGQPLSQMAAGRLFLQLAQCVAEDFAPVPLIALLQHPLSGAGTGRPEWLEHARLMERALRGPRPAAGLEPLKAIVSRLSQRHATILPWWEGVVDCFTPLLNLDAENSALADWLDALTQSAESLAGETIWAREDGRALASFIEDLRLHARNVGTRLPIRDLPMLLRDALEQVAVRPPYGGHPRIAIYGLLESRMSRAELVICAGLNEGVWPGTPSPDPLLAPPILRALGVPAGDFRIGLSAHDLAGALGAPEVVLSRSRRDAEGPAIPSRFLLRVQALLGDRLARDHAEQQIAPILKALDYREAAKPYPRPQPRPSAELRDVAIRVTALDRLRSDPYQFYADAILELKSLDGLDEAPSAAWQGTAAHLILENWHRHGGDLATIARQTLSDLNAHPLMRGLWLPRLLAALDWVGGQIGEDRREGREPILWEEKGSLKVDGVTIQGRADRIDKLGDGTLAVVDYKTGKPPSSRMVEQGFALQLGLIGLMLERGGFKGAEGSPTRFEYWSLGKDSKRDDFGYIDTPVLEGRKRTGIPVEDFLPETEAYLKEAIARWIKGDEPFTARLNPDVPVYGDYDQLMRLEEWFSRNDEGKTA